MPRRERSAAVDSGIKVPDDLAVTGYDDTFIAAISQISLTSVNPDCAGIGALAARCILQRIGDPSRAPGEYLLPPRLVVRSSAATPPAHLG